MSTSGRDKPGQLAELANRLRLLQVDLADQPPEARRGYLKEEIGRVLASSVMPEDRDGFLQALVERFPLWAQGAPAAPSPRQEPAPSPPPPVPQAPPDPHAMIEELAKRVKTAAAEDRKAIREHMVRVGLVLQAPPRQAERPKPPPRPESEPRPDVPKAVDLLNAIIEHLGVLDTIVWGVWKEIAPQSRIVRPADLGQELSLYVSGGADASRTTVLDHVDRLRKLILSLVAAVRATGRRCAINHLAKFSPQDIQEAVGGGWGQEAKCWRKYVELAEELDPAFMEREIMSTLARLAEELMTQQSR